MIKACKLWTIYANVTWVSTSAYKSTCWSGTRAVGSWTYSRVLKETGVRADILFNKLVAQKMSGISVCTFYWLYVVTVPNTVQTDYACKNGPLSTKVFVKLGLSLGPMCSLFTQGEGYGSSGLPWSLGGGGVPIFFLPPLPWGSLVSRTSHLVLSGRPQLIMKRAVPWAFWLGGPECALHSSGA